MCHDELRHSCGETLGHRSNAAVMHKHDACFNSVLNGAYSTVRMLGGRFSGHLLRLACHKNRPTADLRHRFSRHIKKRAACTFALPGVKTTGGSPAAKKACNR
jgi:hypothetical protein